MTPRRIATAVALLGIAVIAAGVGWIYRPAGVIVGGLELLGAAYVIAYLGGSK